MGSSEVYRQLQGVALDNGCVDDPEYRCGVIVLDEADSGVVGYAGVGSDIGEGDSERLGVCLVVFVVGGATSMV